ncbi:MULTISPECIES: response regulator [Pseudomonadota]|jgi:CheY-like chemotaxis protein|uniref:histidine kinase n=3 Tax=Ralstonia TaxID=48736 RepID=R0CM91_RALPI|nr:MULTISPECIES: response regulator [Pseudomonadota]ENZ77781.1 signal transduction histidine kinase [Ralstonia pickettii OR214]MCM3582116.1 response regulator [Ralstonia pickettii]
MNALFRSASTTCAMKCLQTLYSHYRDYHSHGRNTLKYAGVVGAIGYPLFFLVYTEILPQPYESLVIRLIATVACVLLALRDRWPTRLKGWYLAYSYGVLLYCLPFFHVFMSLKNHGNLIFIADSLMAVFLLVLLTDWRNTVAMLLIGTGLGVLLYVTTTEHPTLPGDYIARLPTFVLIVVGGSLFKFSEKQLQNEKLRIATSLAGSIAHEMRNPLTQIQLGLDAMGTMLPAPTTQHATQTLSADHIDRLYFHLNKGQMAIHSGLQVISMILNEVHAKASDAEEFVYIGAASIVEKALADYGYESEEERRKISVVVHHDFVFKGDETIVVFVLFNLIKNALYYFKAHPDARLTLTVDQSEIRVRDTGPGISKAMLPRVFEPFQSMGKTGGTGLGLAYCRRTMQALGGEIRCDSALGQYTEFSLRFPVVLQSELDAHHEVLWQQAMSAFVDKRLLVVDDIAVERRVLRHKLEGLPVHVDEAENGLQALHLMRQHHYDVVLMDLNMPVLDGYAASEKIRAGEVPSHQTVPVIACTNESPNIAKLKTAKVGMSGFVSKTCSRSELVQTLRQALEQPTSASSEPAMLAGKTVLLADDDPYGRAIVRTWLQKHDVQVVEAAHGQAVLDHLATSSPCDVLVLDINMPGLNGLQTARAIRAQSSAYQQLPIVALTGHIDDATIESARTAGMDDFISKPVEAAVLVQTLVRRLKAAAQSVVASNPNDPPHRQPAAALPDEPLLNLARLEGLRQDGVLEEFADDYLGLVDPLLAQLEQGLAARDLELVEEAMHSLLGVSGNLGGMALHRLIRHTYEQVVAGRWPDDETWLSQIQTLTTQTVRALRAILADH